MQKVYLDVTNLMELNFLTGIQRVVREVVIRLQECPGIELCLLREAPGRTAYCPVTAQEFRCHLAGGDCACGLGPVLEPADLETGAIWYDVDAVWGARLKRAWLYPLLKQHGVRVITFVHDVIPVTEPQYCHMDTVCQFMDYVGAVLNYAAAVFVSTQATKRVIQELQIQLHAPRCPLYVTGLGADFSAQSAEKQPVSPEVQRFVEGKRYVLLVSTLEPRKNHTVLLDAFDAGLFEEGMALVFAGRRGWNVETLCGRIAAHPQKGRLFAHFEGENDATIDYLYRHAFVAAYPSFDEGFGLPVIEALSRGTPVVSSDCAVLREVGGDCCLYCSPRDPEAWRRTFHDLAQQPERYERLKSKQKMFRVPTWDTAVHNMETLLCDMATLQ